MPAPSLRLAAGAAAAQTVVMAIAFAIALGYLSDGDPFDGTPADFLLVAAIHTIDAAIVIGLVLVWLGGESLSRLGWGKESRPWRALGLGLGGAIVCVSLVAGAGALLGGGLRGALEGFAAIPPEQRLLCALIGLGAALIEETVFRGALQPALQARMGRAAGISLMALIFSAYHLRFAPVGFAIKALFGLVFGALRDRTGHNWAPALAHAGVWIAVGFS